MTDGDIGRVNDPYFDDQVLAIGYFIVNTKRGGRIAPRVGEGCAGLRLVSRPEPAKRVGPVHTLRSPQLLQGQLDARAPVLKPAPQGPLHNTPEPKAAHMNKPTQSLHQLGQSLWLDNITRTLLQSGSLAHYISDLSVTGLTSNPTIFEHAIGAGDSYDASIRVLSEAGLSGEELFFELAIEDLSEPTTRPIQSRRRTGCMRRPPRQTCSSRFRAPPKALKPLRRSSLTACRSTSRYCSLANM